MISIGKL